MPKSTYASLMEAIQSNDLRTFRSMLQSKDLRNGVWWMDYDLLKKAMALDRKVIASYLLEKGCSVWKPHDKTIPLHIAVAKKDWHDLVEKLLCLGSKVSARNTAGDTAVHVAFKKRVPCNILDMLIESYLYETSTSVRNKEQLGVLHIACTRPKIEFVKQFFHFHRTSIDLQVSLKSNSSYAGYTPLHFAVEHGRREIVAYLLERGANLYLQDRNGSTPLHLALEYCDIKMVTLICDYLSKFDNIVNRQGLSHFMVACASNDPSLVERFLSVADPDALITSRVKKVSGYPFAGYTPLHFAAVYNRVHIARLLLYCHGEELFWAVTAKNHTASSLAFEKKRYRIAKLFAAYCVGGNVWAKEVKKIDKKSVVRKIRLNVEKERFTSFCEFDLLDKIVEYKVQSEETYDDACEAVEDLDDTIPLEDSDDDDEDLIDKSVLSRKTLDREAPIGLTPLSTRSRNGKRDELFLMRMQELHKMSKRFFFNVDQDEDEGLQEPLFSKILSAVRPVQILMGTILLWQLFVQLT